MIITSHAGHNPDGKIACGAVGLIKESTEARAVNAKVISLLRAAGHTVHDVTVNDGVSQADILNKIVAQCNAVANVGLNMSIHFNSGANDLKGNEKTTGTEVWIQALSSAAKPYAEAICKRIAELGYKNRGVKACLSQNPVKNLAVLKNTNKPTALIECCFVDDEDDVILYNADKMAKAIAQGILDVAGGTLTSEKSVARWVKDGDKWKYLRADGSYVKDEWELINGRWYHFDLDGLMQTGLLKLGTEKFYLNEDKNSDEGACMTADARGALHPWDVK